MKQRRKLSLISGMHYVKLLLRSLLFISAIVLYILSRYHGGDGIFLGFEEKTYILLTIWIAYAFEMACRFFPSRLESMGCQKQFKRNYMPSGESKPRLQSAWRTFFVALVWCLLNGAIGILYYTHVIDEGVLILVSLFYGVADMICILFFCPFQTWIMKNRCCTDCRIYNWDFAMMFTPFVFVPTLYTYSLLSLSLLLLFRWEITLRLHPERFSEKTNCSVSCANCKEKLCHHKKQLRGFIFKNRARFRKNTRG